MSHVTKLKTELRNIQSLCNALDQLGFAWQRDGSIKDFYDKVQNVDLAVKLDSEHSVGFNWQEGQEAYELVGDWYGTGTSQEEFLGRVRSLYARDTVLDSLESQGIDTSRVKEHQEDDGSIVYELILSDQDMDVLMAE